MAGIPLLTDNHVREPILKAFRMIFWRADHRQKMSDGDFVDALARIASKEDAFSYPIEYIKPSW